MDVNGIARNNLVVDNSRRVVLGVLALAIRVSQHRCPQDVVGVAISAANAFVDHVFQAHGGVPADVHPDLHENSHNAGILANRPMALGAHSGVDQDLRHGILCRCGLFPFVGLMYGLDEIHRMVIGNKLQSVCHALYKIILSDHRRHGLVSLTAEALGGKYLDFYSPGRVPTNGPRRKRFARTRRVYLIPNRESVSNGPATSTVLQRRWLYARKTSHMQRSEPLLN